MTNFAQIGDTIINLDELLYVKKCMHKDLYVCIFKQGAEVNLNVQTGQKTYDNSVVFLNPKEYKKLSKFLNHAQKQTHPKV